MAKQASPASYKSRSKWSKKGAEIHALLTTAFPEHRTADYDVFDIGWFSAKLKMTDEGIYKWFRDGRISYKRAVQITKIRGCRIELEDILPYVA